ncbi:UNVERIFIED_CONTAM: F-box/FBD/LRR-repeat protein [Sesamum radiatum]|uniref:F-box/FBD/LRR-repeat protein n=1 Tax=Sesamum radiatum TaxID=300843 RepID=A0AAW2QFD7_SESRA
MTETADRISNLPINVIDNILEYLPLCDAVRTSILSRGWRYKWITIPYLDFDQTFKDISLRYNLESIIYQVLLLHEGPIVRFTIDIADFNVHPTIVHWLHFLSKRRVEELRLQLTPGIHYAVSQHLFTFDHLRHLNLANGELRPPEALQGFGRLVKLILDNVNIAPAEFTRHIAEVSCVLCLIKSSPNLLSLEISSATSPVVEDTTTQFLKEQQKCKIPLSCLGKVKILKFSGDEPEMEFVKLILSATTILRKLEISSIHAGATEAGSKMLKQLLSFQRASPRAEIIFKDP